MKQSEYGDVTIGKMSDAILEAMVGLYRYSFSAWHIYLMKQISVFSCSVFMF